MPLVDALDKLIDDGCALLVCIPGMLALHLPEAPFAAGDAQREDSGRDLPQGRFLRCEERLLSCVTRHHLLADADNRCRTVSPGHAGQRLQSQALVERRDVGIAHDVHRVERREQVEHPSDEFAAYPLTLMVGPHFQQRNERGHQPVRERIDEAHDRSVLRRGDDVTATAQDG